MGVDLDSGDSESGSVVGSCKNGIELFGFTDGREDVF
jgi:hypothetical protein